MNIPANLRKGDCISFVCLKPCARLSSPTPFYHKAEVQVDWSAQFCAERQKVALIPVPWVTLGHANMDWILWLCS